jgi:hypothetical protein
MTTKHMVCSKKHMICSKELSQLLKLIADQAEGLDGTEKLIVSAIRTGASAIVEASDRVYYADNTEGLRLPFDPDAFFIECYEDEEPPPPPEMVLNVDR